MLFDTYDGKELSSSSPDCCFVLARCFGSCVLVFVVVV